MVRLRVVLLLLLGIGLLVACGSSPTLQAVTPIATAAAATLALPPSTSATLPPATTVPNSLTATVTGTHIGAADAFETRIAQHHADIYTMVALSPSPINPPAPPTVRPYPTDALVFGWVGCPEAEHGGQPHFSNCWVGAMAGQIMWLRAGRYGHGGRGENIQDGLLDMVVMDAAQNVLEAHSYTTPQELGAVHMTSIRGTLVTLEPDVQPNPPVQFIFDFSLHDWLRPTEIPLTLPPSSVPLPPTMVPPPPTLAPTPEPSVAPSAVATP